MQNRVVKPFAAKFLLCLLLLVGTGGQLIAEPLTNTSTGHDWQSATAEEQKQYCDILVQNLPNGASQVTSTVLRDFLNSFYASASADILNLKVVGVFNFVASAIASKLKDDNALLGTWRALTTRSVESSAFGDSLVSAHGQIKITRDASGKLIGSGSFSVKTKTITGVVMETKGDFTARTLQYILVPSSPGIIDDASPNRYRVTGNFSSSLAQVTTAQLFFSNQGMLSIQCGGQISGFDRIFFVKQ